MNRINKKILEDIDILSKAMEKNNLFEIKFSDESVSYELKKYPRHNVNNHSDLNTIENKPIIEKEVNLTENALKSPMVGTAYLSPEPSAKKFIEEGQNVKIGQVLLIIEAMKTMNEITADKNGKVKKIFVKNESPVEFGEPLVLIE
ncbi:MAG: acetyl-CoA carboxylase biotin carboxyl carrier protein subunit [Pelagibacteraceae bacterium TMED124]|nr:acetyl-CoA carboxylase biotin carboxyl carrier protein subunit [Rickettsiales bacterium]RPG16664.1 MAG: acetyl-CoA carboxylase biotin carboxyl carrier protein subunit [Pelagibacteraceae bacterium TMED124]|tara:strand:+ start:5302 stop:5739 length:438 start_codon:yes stop_codon:yes gene_type:complete